jgi:hypothetical protein
VKDSRQFKQREKRLLKVETVNLPLSETTIILKSCISCCGDSQTWERQYPKNGEKIGREKGYWLEFSSEFLILSKLLQLSFFSFWGNSF